jgi:hypothetical protein
MIIRVRHAEPVIDAATLIARLGDRVQWIATPPRATLVQGSSHAWRSARSDEAWDPSTNADSELTVLDMMTASAMATQHVVEHDPVSAQWWVGLEGMVDVLEGGVTYEELCRALARAVADSVSWRGYLDSTVDWAHLPADGSALLRRMLDGSPDSHGIYARALVAVTDATGTPVTDTGYRPQARPPTPAGMQVSMTGALAFVGVSLAIIVGGAILVTRDE